MQRGEVQRQLHALFRSGTLLAGLSDGQLLERFTTRGDEEDAERAFATLVERHGPMVLRVCRRILCDAHDAEDAFQATFLVLARKAGSIQRRNSVGSWLHGVALRVAAEARSATARRQAHERKAAELQQRAEPVTPAESDDLGGVVDEEIGRLPERLREAIVLCYLEGRTCEEAAAQLGWPVGTVKTRLAKARAQLGPQLIRRGVAPLAAMALASSEAAAFVVVPTTLGESTIRAASWFAGTQATIQAGTVSASVITLAERGIRNMRIAKLKLVAGLLSTAGALTIGTGLFLHQTWGAQFGSGAPIPPAVPVAPATPVPPVPPTPPAAPLTPLPPYSPAQDLDQPLAQQVPPLSPRPRWEYRTQVGENIGEFNRLGNEGWELCGVLERTTPQSPTFIFKRQSGVAKPPVVQTTEPIPKPAAF